jgi:hypothetical protein
MGIAIGLMEALIVTPIVIRVTGIKMYVAVIQI